MARHTKETSMVQVLTRAQEFAAWLFAYSHMSRGTRAVMFFGVALAVLAAGSGDWGAAVGFLLFFSVLALCVEGFVFVRSRLPR
jgi:hypothetical protein